MMDGAAIPGDDGIDRDVLPALLARLGPQVAPELRRQLGADLQNLRDLLAQALTAPPDMAMVARHAHALIALAGCAGDLPSASGARHLHSAADAGRTSDLPGLSRALLPRIDRLAAYVAACPLPGARSAP